MGKRGMNINKFCIYLFTHIQDQTQHVNFHGHTDVLESLLNDIKPSH
jgi:hypothetical protein